MNSTLFDNAYTEDTLAANGCATARKVADDLFFGRNEDPYYAYSDGDTTVYDDTTASPTSLRGFWDMHDPEYGFADSSYDDSSQFPTAPIIFVFPDDDEFFSQSEERTDDEADDFMNNCDVETAQLNNDNSEVGERTNEVGLLEGNRAANEGRNNNGNTCGGTDSLVQQEEGASKDVRDKKDMLTLFRECCERSNDLRANMIEAREAMKFSAQNDELMETRKQLACCAARANWMWETELIRWEIVFLNEMGGTDHERVWYVVP